MRLMNCLQYPHIQKNMATIVGTFPGNDLGKGDRVYILAEYSSEEKAIKAMKMCREEYQDIFYKR